MLSNNHVFSRSSSNLQLSFPAFFFPPWNATVGLEKINQPSAGPVAGTLLDYEFYCSNIAGDCAGGAQNQLNRINRNCIDAAVADPCADAQPVVDDGDILDVGKPAALGPFTAVATPTAPQPTATPNCSTNLSYVARDMIVKKSGATSGLTCGRITLTNVALNFGLGRTFVGQFEAEAVDPYGYDVSVPGQVNNGNFTCPGDSGSLWVGVATNRAVGLHFAGDAGARNCTAASFGFFCTAGTVGVPCPSKKDTDCDTMAGSMDGKCQERMKSSSDSNPIDLVLRRFKVHF
jgi:hypothetical protein